MRADRRVALQWVATLLVVGLLVLLLWFRRDDLSALRGVDIATLLLASGTVLLGFVLNGAALQLVTRRFGVRLGLLEATQLQIATYALNYLPMKGGTVLIGAVMRAKHGLALSHYVSLSTAGQLMTLSTFSVLGGVGVLGVGGHPWWGALMVAAPVVCVLVLYGWSRRTAGRAAEPQAGRVRRMLITVREGFQELMGDHRLLVGLAALNVAILGVQAVRIHALFAAVDADVSLFTAVAVSGIGSVAYMFGFLPGGLGFREGGVVGGALVVGVSASAGVAVAVADRAIDLAWVILLLLPVAVAVTRRADVRVGLSGVTAEESSA